jgi:four helix bundle protein
VRNFRELKVWEKAHRLTLEVYRMTGSFPREEAYGLTSQMRRCAASIPANIAEGCGRGTDVDFARFLQIAAGSASELEYHLILTRDLGLASDGQYDDLAEGVTEVKRMLVAFIAYAKRNGTGIGRSIGEASPHHSYFVASLTPDT